MKYLYSSFLFIFIFSSYSQIAYDTIYTKTYGNSVFHTEGLSVAEISESNIMLSSGYYGGLGSCDWRPKLYKVNQVGDTIWSSYALPGVGPIIKSDDGHFFNARSIENTTNCSLDSSFAIKFDINGDTIWTKKFFLGICNNNVSDILQTSDGGFAILSFFSITNCANPLYNSSIIKLDNFGNTEWIKYYGSATEYVQARSFVQTNNNDYVFSYFRLNSSGRSYRISKANSLGGLVWDTSIYVGADVAGDSDIDLLPNDDIVFGGKSSSADVLAKVDGSGSVSLFPNYPTSIAGDINVLFLENINAYLYTSAGYIYIIDVSGTVLWTSINFNASLKDIIQTSNGDLITTGYRNNGVKEQIFIARLKDSNANSIVKIEKTTNYRLYPNPFSDYATLEFEGASKDGHDLYIYNTLGQLLYTIYDLKSNKVLVDAKKLGSGLYLFQLKNNGIEVSSGKIVIK